MSKHLMTHVTCEWLLTCMNMFVSVKMTGVAKRLTTHVTPEWLYTCMNMSVCVKTMRMAELNGFPPM